MNHNVWLLILAVPIGLSLLAGSRAWARTLSIALCLFFCFGACFTVISAQRAAFLQQQAEGKEVSAGFIDGSSKTEDIIFRKSVPLFLSAIGALVVLAIRPGKSARAQQGIQPDGPASGGSAS